MEIKFNNKELKEVLEIVRGGVQNNSNHQILSSVLFRIIGNTLNLFTNDSEIEINTQTTLSDTYDKIEFAIKLIDLHNILLRIDEEESIIFKINNNTLTLVNNKNTFNLNILNKEDFNSSIHTTNEGSIDVSTEELLNLIKKTSFTIGQDMVMSVLNGMLLEIDKEFINTVTSDGHRLSMASITSPHNKTKRAIIPKKTIAEIVKLLNNTSEPTISLFVDEYNIILSNDHTTIKSKLISGGFPDYQTFFPDETDIQIVINNSLFKKALKQTEIFTKENKTINLEFTPGELTISAESERGNAKSVVDLEGYNGELTVGFNVAYLLQTLQNIDEEHVIFEMQSTKENALVLRGKDNTIAKYLVMAVKV